MDHSIQGESYVFRGDQQIPVASLSPQERRALSAIKPPAVPPTNWIPQVRNTATTAARVAETPMQAVI